MYALHIICVLTLAFRDVQKTTVPLSNVMLATWNHDHLLLLQLIQSLKQEVLSR